MSRLSVFLAELKRRRVYRVAAIYAAVGFVVWQAADFAVPAMNLPESVSGVILLFTVLGFPIAIALAWAYEVRPEDPKPSQPAPKESSAIPEAPVPTGVGAAEHGGSIAVLSFVDMSPDQDQEYFCDGMAEELINALTKVPGLRVAARTSSFHFKGRSEDVREIGRELSVGAVLEGSVRRAEDRLRVTAQLVSVEDGFHLWSENYDRELKDVFAVQDEISRSIVETLRPTLIAEEEPKLVEAPTKSLEAYDHCLRGRHYWEGRYEKGLMTALRYFERAVEIDPEYALPHTGIADSYTVLGMYGFLRPEEARQRAWAAAQRAAELDDLLSEAHASLGLYHMWLVWDWERSAAELQRAVELNPDHGKAYAWLGFLLGLQGRFEEAFHQLAVSRRLDPLSSYVTSLSGTVQTFAGDLTAASEMLEGVVTRDPSYLLAVWLLSWTYSHMARHDLAVRMGERALTLSNDAGHFKGSLGLIYGRAGMHDRARAVLEDLSASEDSQYVSPLWLAWVQLGLGDDERALDLLAQAAAQRTPWLFQIHQDPNYHPLRSYPRFTELAGRVGSGMAAD